MPEEKLRQGFTGTHAEGVWVGTRAGGVGRSTGPPEGRLKWSARPPGGAVCSNHARDLAFAPSTSDEAVGSLVFLYLVHNLSPLLMCAVIFGSL